MTTHICHKCQKHLKSSHIICGLCQQPFHKKCTPINKASLENWSHWSCSDCLLLFPFHDVENIECVNLLAENRCQGNFEHLVFNPFDINEDNHFRYNGSFDADSNFLYQALSGSTVCDYYNESTFISFRRSLPVDESLFSSL